MIKRRSIIEPPVFRRLLNVPRAKVAQAARRARIALSRPSARKATRCAAKRTAMPMPNSPLAYGVRSNSHTSRRQHVKRLQAWTHLAQKNIGQCYASSALGRHKQLSAHQ